MLFVMWLPKTSTTTTNLFGPSAHLSVPWQIYNENPARHIRLTTTEMGGLRSLNLGESDMKLGIGTSGMEEAGEGTFSRIHVKIGAVIEYLDGIMVTHANDSLFGGKYAIQATSKDK